MGVFSVKVLFKAEKNVEKELIVDIGSVYTWVSRKFLEDIGVKPKRKRHFKTITGRVVERDVGEVTIVIDGEEGTIPVVFAEDKDQEVLGATALEILGLEIDPTAKRLRKVKALLAL